ncbi:hypothetical protein ES703_119234 [subsurface metagenome]
MKATKFRRAWVIKQVKHYCELLCVKPPRVILTAAEYERWKAEERIRCGWVRVGRSDRHYLGVCHHSSNMIVVFLKRLRNLKAVDTTIRHELIHLTKPSYGHRTDVFYERMEQLKRGKIKNGRFHK